MHGVLTRSQNDTTLTLMGADRHCQYYSLPWQFQWDYFHQAEYLGERMCAPALVDLRHGVLCAVSLISRPTVEITTPYFHNVTCHRFHGEPPAYEYEFDVYTTVRGGRHLPSSLLECC